MIIFVYAVVIAVILCGIVSFAVHIRNAFFKKSNKHDNNCQPAFNKKCSIHNHTKTCQSSVDNSVQK